MMAKLKFKLFIVFAFFAFFACESLCNEEAEVDESFTWGARKPEGFVLKFKIKYDCQVYPSNDRFDHQEEITTGEGSDCGGKTPLDWNICVPENDFCIKTIAEVSRIVLKVGEKEFPPLLGPNLVIRFVLYTYYRINKISKKLQVIKFQGNNEFDFCFSGVGVDKYNVKLTWDITENGNILKINFKEK